MNQRGVQWCVRQQGQASHLLPYAWYSHGGPNKLKKVEAFVAEKVRAELVANVLSIAVNVGDLVDPGQELLLLESMKMEIPVLPETGGTITAIAVQPGDHVQAGDLLVEIE